MDTFEAAEKLKEAGLYARAFGAGDKIHGGTHKIHSGSSIGVIYGHFEIKIEQNCVMISIAKDSLEEAINFLIDNVKPGISDEPPERVKTTGPCYY